MAPAVIGWGHQIWGVMSMASVGTHIKRLRAARGLTQEALAERLFVTRQVKIVKCFYKNFFRGAGAWYT